MTSLAARLRPIWGDEGRGAVWLTAGVGVNFVLGLLLQLIALRALAAPEYSLFVVSLGIGNVANAVAAAVQPVVALRTGQERPTFAPVGPGLMGATTTAAMALGTLAFARSMGPAAALLALLQFPLYTLAGVGLGRLQATRRFGRMAVCLASWSIVRVLVVAPAVVVGHATGLVFVVALVGGHAFELALLAAFGAFRGVSWRRDEESERLLGYYALFALVAWLLNADVVFARVFLSPQQAGAYAVAFSIGRQPVYAVAPLTMVLLPVTLAGHPEEQRARLWAILAAAGLLFAGTFAVAGIRPGPLLRLLTGEVNPAVIGLVRGYAVAGSLAAAATLLVTFVFALGCPASLRVPIALAIGGFLVALAVVRRPDELLALQCAVVALLTLHFGRLSLRGTRVPASLESHPQRQAPGARSA